MTVLSSSLVLSGWSLLLVFVGSFLSKDLSMGMGDSIELGRRVSVGDISCYIALAQQAYCLVKGSNQHRHCYY